MNIYDIWKEFKWIITTLIGVGIFTVPNVELVLHYNLHIFLFIILSDIGILIVVKNVMKEQEKQRLKATVYQVYSEHKESEIINVGSVVKYIYNLESERLRLKVNSYTQEQLTILIEKIEKGMRGEL